MTFSVNGSQHSGTRYRVLLCLVSQHISYYAECHYAQCHYAQCHYAQCHYAQCHYAQCNYAECQYVECHYAELLSVIMLSVVILRGVMLNVVAPHSSDNLKAKLLTIHPKKVDQHKTL
jgi:hypothetical protein